MKRTIALLFLLATRTLCTAADPDELFSKGNQLYADEKPAEAVKLYQQALEEGPRASVLYNLGNAYFRLGDLGKSALAYERALTLEPGFADAAANLKFTREKAGAKIAESAFWEQPLLHLHTPLAMHMAEACIVLSILAALWGSTQRERRGWLWAALGLQILTLGTGAATWFAVKRHAQFAIITGSITDARTEPADRAGLAESLPSGSRLRLLSTHGAWAYCELPSGSRGWLPTGAVESLTR